MSGMAEREGFEPPVRLHVLRISSAARSTTLPPLRGTLPMRWSGARNTEARAQAQGARALRRGNAVAVKKLQKTPLAWWREGNHAGVCLATRPAKRQDA